MRNIITVDGYSAKIEFDPTTDMFRGEILGLSGGADFYGKTPEQLRTEFKKSLDYYLKICARKGIEPREQYSGKLMLRISPEVHERAALLAQAQGKSINAWIADALAKVEKQAA
jgi:predicted HicB family RNase H-like nuclease